MSEHVDRARIAELARQILDEVTDDPGQPGELAPPSGFTAVLNRDRSVTCRWTDPAAGEAVEVHEFLADPDTLAATVPVGVEERTSGPLAGGHDYAYAVRAVAGGDVSAFTERVTLYVPAEGETPDEDEPDDGDEDEEPGGVHPDDVLPVLKHWTIMLPTGSPGDPDNEYLVGVSIPDTYFVRDDGHGRGVVFRTYPATANHSANSKYGRTEGRQMVPGKRWEKSSWSSSEPHRLTARLAVDTSRLAYEIVNALQIHDGGDDVAQVQVREGVLGVSHKDGKAWEVLDPAYGGQTVDIKIEVTGGGELVFVYNGIEQARIEKSGSGWYWKAGCYPNTGGANKDRPERPDAFAEVVIYKLEVIPA